MAKVKFRTIVKFNGKLIEANQPFDVDDKEFEALVNGGAIGVESPKVAKPVVAEKAPAVEKPKGAKKEDKAKK